MAYGGLKDLTRRTGSDKTLRDKAFNIPKNPKYDACQCGLDSMFYKFFDKKTFGSGIKNKNILNKKLAEELHKPVLRKFKKRKVHSCFKDNVSGADLIDMPWLSKFNKGIRFLLCVIDIYSKYAWVIPLKDKKGITVIIVIQKNWDKSKGKPNKIWVDKSSEFYNRSKKSFLQNNDIEMHSTHDEGKFVIGKRFIRTLKNKIHEYMTSISENVYIDRLDDTVNKCNYKYYGTINIKTC